MTGVKITGLSAAGALVGTELVEIVQSGVNVKETVNNLKTFINSGITESVTSVFGRAGDVVSANGDYAASQITNIPAGNISSTDVQSALNELDSSIPVVGTIASQDADDVNIAGGVLDDVIITDSLLNGLNIHETIHAIAVAPNNPATGATGSGSLTDMGSGGYTFYADITNDLATDISNISAALAVWGFLGIDYTIDTAPNGNLRITNNQISGNRNFGLSAAFTNYGYLSYFASPHYQYTNNPSAGDLLVYDEDDEAFKPTPAPTPYVPEWQIDDLSGDVDGVNVDFTLSETPVENSVFIFNNTAFRVLNIDYTISGDIITFDVAPADGTILTAQYMVA